MYSQFDTSEFVYILYNSEIGLGGNGTTVTKTITNNELINPEKEKPWVRGCELMKTI
jgi:hypothetical protein